MSFKKNIFIHSLVDIFKVWKREFKIVFHDTGALIFFMLLPTAYPIVYSLIYNPELVREIPVTVVDDSRTPLSREFTRNLNATEYVNIISYSANREEAKRLMDEKECYGILYIPEDFSRAIGRGEQANVSFYSEMSLLIRYRSFLVSLNNIVMEMGAKIQSESIGSIAPSYASVTSDPIPSFQLQG